MARTRGEGTLAPPGIDLSSISLPSINVTVQACPPDMLSQRNIEAATGIPARTFLELARDPGFEVPVVRLGKLRLVNRAAFLKWLDAQALEANRLRSDVYPSPAPDEAMHENDGATVAAERVLAELGLRVLPRATLASDGSGSQSGKGARRRGRGDRR